MKRYALVLAALTTTALLAGTASMAQEENDKAPVEKDKFRQYDEIIIRKKSDKDDKITIEIKDGEVLVNGKPLTDYNNENLSIRRGRTIHYETASPFRQRPDVLQFHRFDGNEGGAQLYGGGTVDPNRAFLGVATEEAPGGARITSLNENSGASKAGLKKGDIITRIDKETIKTHDDVVKAVKAHKPDDKIVIAYRRDNKEQSATVILGKAPQAETFSFSGPEGGALTIPQLDGLRDLQFNLGDQFRGMGLNGRGGRLGIRAQDTEDGKGVKVLSVADESAAEKAGIKEDDVITQFDGKTVNSADELAAAAQEAREKQAVTVKLTRDGKSQTVELKTPKKLKTATL
ncbi:MAG: PDZ domain-containing protein [Candidatus Pseudobacter hemicellulosilyticus]|uniref:PDZ domain-containing protein n=1 Tax=Candidatus Pseudobacter hemicellulosilyticus TaxID=3121375 RepID=A0AAJ5WVF7_9BACT|nr:MAG: PDZ domain-containing protein [Pseudobacter sp.]